uniref:Putative secreted protein n=1 Tax=Panstrongylus lignarius TaxID=156445 RepID=A0A224Y3N3_9HEMI
MPLRLACSVGSLLLISELMVLFMGISSQKTNLSDPTKLKTLFSLDEVLFWELFVVIRSVSPKIICIPYCYHSLPLSSPLSPVNRRLRSFEKG